MAKRIVFSDENDHDLECYLNHEGKVFISVGQRDADPYYSGFITLDKEDIGHLIGLLTTLESEMVD